MLNQKMLVAIGEHRFEIEHKTMMGNLNQFWAVGNAFRIKNGKTPKHLENWLRSQETAEFVEALERDLKSVDSTDLEKPLKNKAGLVPTVKSTLIKSKRGQGGGTWAHLYILLDAATHLDADFKVMVYKSFVEGNILKNRDDAGNNYLPMNRAICKILDKSGEDARPYIIEIAKLLADKIGVSKPATGENRWNYANAEQLQARSTIEQKMTDLVNLGLVKNYNHFKELLSKV